MLAHDLKHAFLDGNFYAPCGIGWNKTKARWMLYDLTEGAPENVRPDFLCTGSGRLPVPLNQYAKEALATLLIYELNI